MRENAAISEQMVQHRATGYCVMLRRPSGSLSYHIHQHQKMLWKRAHCLVWLYPIALSLRL